MMGIVKEICRETAFAELERGKQHARICFYGFV